jgi:hypothetical protein
VYSLIHNSDASKLEVQTDYDLIPLSAAVAYFTDRSLFKYVTREGNAFVFYVQLLFLRSDWVETTSEVLH